mgnify:CR=1 FL=1
MVQLKEECNIVDNTEKNNYVKKQITNALLRLLKEKKLKDISISEITTTAKVSRISFYRNYHDKDTIIKEYMYLTLNAWNENHPQNNEHTEALLRCRRRGLNHIPLFSWFPVLWLHAL